MRSSTFVLLALLVSPIAAAAQRIDGRVPPSRSPVFSVTVDGLSGLPRLGVWKPLGQRLTLGLEVESGVQSSTRFPNWDQSRAIHHRDWRLAVGPSAAFRLVRFAGVSLLAYGGATYGVHAFDVRDSLEDRAGPAERGFALRAGLELDRRVSDHWTLGATYLRRWTSAPGMIGGVAREAWRGPALGLTVKFHF